MVLMSRVTLEKHLVPRIKHLIVKDGIDTLFLYMLLGTHDIYWVKKLVRLFGSNHYNHKLKNKKKRMLRRMWCESKLQAYEHFAQFN